MRRTLEVSGALALLLAACQSETTTTTPARRVAPGQSAPASAPAGSLSEAQAREVLEGQASAVRGCFAVEARWLLSVSLRVEPSGQVSQVSVFDLMQGSAAASCAEGALRALRFPAFSGDAQRVSYSYTLRPVIAPAESSAVPVPVAQSQPFGVASAPAAPWSVPADASAALLQAERLFALGELDAAEQALAPFQEKLLPEMVYLLGGIAARRGQVERMCEYYRRYLEVSPQSPAAPGLQRQIQGACSK